MREARIGVYHQGCWGSYSTEKFPEIKLKMLSPTSILKHDVNGVHLHAIWELTAPSNKTLDDYLNYVKNIKDMHELLVLEKDAERALISTKWRSPTSSYEQVINNRCLHTAPVLQENGYEIYNILAKDPKEITKLLNSFEDIGGAKIFKIGKYEKKKSPHKLTRKQLDALRVALTYNYYSWPRKVTLEELAQVANTTRRAFQENLRKAEAKVFPILVKDVVEQH